MANSSDADDPDDARDMAMARDEGEATRDEGEAEARARGGARRRRSDLGDWCEQTIQPAWLRIYVVLC